MSYIVCFFSCDGNHRVLHVLTHSFPTRRSAHLGSCPLEQAALQLRICLRPARASSRCGSTTFLNCSNGRLSRKKNDSLVVIATVTSTARQSSFFARRSAISESTQQRSHLRATEFRRPSTIGGATSRGRGGHSRYIL